MVSSFCFFLVPFLYYWPILLQSVLLGLFDFGMLWSSGVDLLVVALNPTVFFFCIFFTASVELLAFADKCCPSNGLNGWGWRPYNKPPQVWDNYQSIQ